MGSRSFLWGEDNVGHQRSGCWKWGGKEIVSPWGHVDAEDQGNMPRGPLGRSSEAKARKTKEERQAGGRAGGRPELGVLNLEI